MTRLCLREILRWSGAPVFEIPSLIRGLDIGGNEQAHGIAALNNQSNFTNS
jgi:hypothetical protein